jgi:translocation and assembly module TamB
MLVFDGRTDPSWSASIRSDELDLALLSPALASSAIAPLALDFTAAGKGGNANLRGKVKQGDQELELAPSVVSLQDQVLKVSPLLVKGLAAKRGWKAPPTSARKTSRNSISRWSHAI